MILLGINCGLGNTDVAQLPQSAINFDTAEIVFPRPKTAVDRRCPLWPETIVALRRAIELRPYPNDPKRDGGLVFLTKNGNRWIRVRESKYTDGLPKFVPIDVLDSEFTKILKNVGINGRMGVGYNALRHTLATEGRGANDDEALKLILGHGDHSMLSEHYTHRFPRQRLDAVSNYVHDWLFGEGGEV